MIPSDTIKTLITRLQSGQKNGACVSPKQVLEDLLTEMLYDSVATEQANKAKVTPSAPAKK